MSLTSPARAWVIRYLIALFLVVSLTTGGVAGAYWFAERKLAGAPTARVTELEASGKVANYLIVGSDSRDFVDDAADLKAFGSEKKIGGQRADVIMIARVDPKTEKGLLVSIPRDTWVSIPDLGRNKINAAYLKGPDHVIQTIKQNFDIPINHYIEINFEGFRNIVDAIGGVRMYVPSPARDTVTGLSVKTAGCQTFGGVQALAWARSRAYQHFESGRWKTDPTADIGRISRQQVFIGALMQQAIRSGLRDPRKLNRFANETLKNIKRDEDLRVKDLLRLASVFKSSQLGAVEMIAMPYQNGRVRGSLEPAPEADAVFARLRGDVLAPPDDANVTPAEVKVRVLNGTGEAGQAGDALAVLGEAGFTTVGSGDASSYGAAQTQVRYGTGDEAKARLIARHLLGIGRIVADPTLRDADVVIVTGKDFRGISRRAGEDVSGVTTTTEAKSSAAKPKGAKEQAC